MREGKTHRESLVESAEITELKAGLADLKRRYPTEYEDARRAVSVGSIDSAGIEDLHAFMECLKDMIEEKM